MNLTLEQAKKYQNTYKRIPLSKTILSDWITPLEALKKLRNSSSHCFLFESVDKKKRWSRYTFIGYDPILEIQVLDHEMQVSGLLNFKEKVKHPKNKLREILKEFKSPKLDSLPPFTGGLVGYFGYDMVQYGNTKLKFISKDKEHFNDLDLMLFDKLVVFDHDLQLIYLIANIALEQINTSYQEGLDEIKRMEMILRDNQPVCVESLKFKKEFESVMSKEEYCQNVEKIQKHIIEGDIFQAVLSNRFYAKASGSLFQTYRYLRCINPSPYMFYLTSNELEIIGSSPETLVKLHDHQLYTYPLAGSRPRGNDQFQDKELEKELLNDEKECSEHNMLVDLGRNDVGKVSEIGSVKVEDYMHVIKYSHIMHIGSTVTGTICKDKDCFDAIDSILPAGTLSGAPKIKACEIIDSLEKDKRGIYGGAIGYIDFTGDMDLCIGIRMIYKKNDSISIRSGAGIVADSKPEKEYEECINKAKALMVAIERSSYDCID